MYKIMAMQEANWRRATDDDDRRWTARADEHIKKVHVVLKNVRPDHMRPQDIYMDICIGVPGEKVYTTSEASMKSLLRQPWGQSKIELEYLNFVVALSRSMDEYPKFQKGNSRNEYGIQVHQLMVGRKGVFFRRSLPYEEGEITTVGREIDRLHAEYVEQIAAIDLRHAARVWAKREAKLKSKRSKAHDKRFREREQEVIEMITAFCVTFGLTSDPEFALKILTFKRTDELAKFQSAFGKSLITYITKERFMDGFKLAQIKTAMDT